MPFAPDLAGSALDGRYELHALIGEGTFGRVYRGFDRRLRRPVAVKVIKPWWAEDPGWAARFEREAQLLARLSDPRVVQIYDVGKSREVLYYVAELVPGESLAARLRRGPLSPAEAAAIAEEVCRALAHTHAGGIIHRDIKPANVLLGPAGHVKLGDFSIARSAELSTDGPATIAGTPTYMAPEHARNGLVTPASDIYSVGVVLYEMLAGRPPFRGRSPVELALSHLQDPPPPLPAGVAAPLRSVVACALEKDPARRFQTAPAMARALAAARSAHGSSSSSSWSDAGASVLVERDVSDATAQPPDAAAQPPDGATQPPDAATQQPDRTRVAPRLGPRRNINPSARRRSAALVAAVAGLVVAMLAAAVLIGGADRTRVPDVRGLTRIAASRALARAHLAPRFASRYATAQAGTAISQSPSAALRVNDGSTIDVVLSAGPAPVRLPALAGDTVAQATAVLARLGLTTRTELVPAPGVTPGTVTAQSPAGGRVVSAHSVVRLAVAQTPRWRPVTTFSGTDAGRSGAFRIRGQRWRLVYRMDYVGLCTFIIFCDGPTAHVRPAADGAGADFDLDRGSQHTRTFTLRPGVYSIQITPGSDTARWTVDVQDFY